MPTYRYHAVQAGARRKISRTLDAGSEAEVISWLKALGLSPIAIAKIREDDLAGEVRETRAADPEVFRLASFKEIGASLGQWWRSAAAQPRIRNKTLSAFTRQLATLIAAGMPILRSLELLSRQERTPAVRLMLNGLAASIRSGESLSAGLARHPRIFDSLYINMIRAGEAGGMMDAVLERLARYLEKAARTRGRVKAALAYPLVIIVVAGGIVAALTTFVVPKFEQIFLSQLNGRSLPLLTQAVLVLSKGVSHHLPFLVFVSALGGFSSVWVARQEWFKHRWHRWALRLPLAGDFLLLVSMTRFCRTCGTLLAAGVPILHALSLTRNATENRAVAAALVRLKTRLEAGAMVAAGLRETGIFPPLLIAMVEVGEATGRLPEMLTGVADVYDEQIDTTVTAFTSLLEPLLIVLMALVVGTIVIALFLPMIEIIRSLSGG
ncbi:MAG: type II secretion system F family protein [Opitutaceae bacterium]|nr:type II secretion system F family protein [Opitutaceae bacterium]